MRDDGGGESDDASGGSSDPRQELPEAPGADETVPRVDLALQDLSVSVTGRSEDNLETVEESARNLMADLVEEANELEDDHDEYGLS